MLEFFTIRRYMHPIFEKFTPYSGMVESGYMADVVGVKTKVSYFSSNHIESHVENCKYPEFNEEFFEWADVFESVFLAKDSYVMAELGAGWGRWLSRAYFACKQMYADMPCHVIGVEAEPTHFQWLKEHCAFNNISATLIEAAIDDVPGEVGFYTGKPTEWYGQCIGGETKVKSIDLKCIFFVVRSGNPFLKSNLNCLPKTEYVPVFVRSLFLAPLSSTSCNNSRYCFIYRSPSMYIHHAARVAESMISPFRIISPISSSLFQKDSKPTNVSNSS